MEDAEKAYYKETHLPVFCYSAQGKGYYSKLSAGQEITGMAKEWFDSQENRRRLPILERIASERKVSVTAVALAYLWSGGVNAFPIIGAKNKAQLADSLSVGEMTLTEEECTAIRKGAWV